MSRLTKPIERQRDSVSYSDNSVAIDAPGSGTGVAFVWLLFLALTISLALPALAQEHTAQASASSDGLETIEQIIDEPEWLSDDPALRYVESQLDGGEAEIAEALIERIIDERESSLDRFNPNLIDPLLLLGDAKRAQGSYSEALDSYTRAVQIERINSGLNSPSQLKGVYREAETLAEMGDLKAANDREEYAYITLLRHHSGASLELIPGLLRLADWYMRTHNIFSARGLYQHAINVIDEQASPTDDRVIAPLRGLATTYERQRHPLFLPDPDSDTPIFDSYTGVSSVSYGSTLALSAYSRGERALQRIVQIERAREPIDPEAVVAAQLDLADWHLMALTPGSRWLPLYKDIFDQLVESGVSPSSINARFAEPKALYTPPPRMPKRPSNDPDPTAVDGVVEAEFRLNNRGRVSAGGITVTRSDPPGMMDFRVKRALAASIFRPPLVDGVPVESDSARHRQPFVYYPRGPAAEPATDDAQAARDATVNDAADAIEEPGDAASG